MAPPGGFFRALDGEIYTFDSLHQVHRLQLTEAGVEFVPIGRFISDGALSMNLETRARHVVSGRLMFQNGLNYVEVDMANQVFVNHVEFRQPFDDTKRLTHFASDRFIWGMGISKADGTPLITRYNPATHESAEIHFDASYELLTFEPITPETVSFTATRLSDQSTVIGIMGVDGQVIEESIQPVSNPASFTLRAITPAHTVKVDGSPRDWNTDQRVLSGPADGPAGDDLTHYSNKTTATEYFGLVEFAGTVDPTEAKATRIIFDTVVITIVGGYMQIDSSDGAVDAIAEGGRVATGTAVEFALPLELFGEGAQPVLQSVERIGVEGGIETVLDTL